MPQFQQVSGGACSLTLYRESSPGSVNAGEKGVRMGFMSEAFKKGSAKKQRTVIRGARGAGKPYTGLPQMGGALESAAYVPQLGHLFSALCGVPATTAYFACPINAAPVVLLSSGFVGIPADGHGFVQDAVITIVGTQNYNGSYRIERGVTENMIAIAAPFVAETITTGATIHRGRVPFLKGAAQNIRPGFVALPVAGGVHHLNAGEKVVIKDTGVYDGTYTLAEGTKNGLLVIKTAFVDEEFDGTSIAIPQFYLHRFALPKRQPTVCMEKFIDFENGAAVNNFRRFSFCKVNGLSFNFGGDDELKFSMDFAVGRESLSATALDASPQILPAVTMDNIETSIFIAGKRRGDVNSGSCSNSFGIEAKAAVGDLGQYSRMPEGDPDCKVSLSVFLETDELQTLVDSRATVPVSIAIASATGDEVWFNYPEAELDSDGPAITGKEGLMQEVTVLPFVNDGNTVLVIELINRVESYA